MGRPLEFGSLCSGIEAASEAWNPLGWDCRYVSEIEPFPCAYLAQTYGAGRPKRAPWKSGPQVRALDRIKWGDRLVNFGDLTQIEPEELPRVDIIAAGFPCQDFSISGLRASLNGARGNVSISGVRLILGAADLGLVCGAVLEQVPAVLNTDDNAWGNILGALVGADDPLEGLEHGGKWPSSGMVAGPRSRVAWRIFDAQHFGLAQRRERVWAVVDFGDGPDPAAVLFERKGVRGNPAKGRGARQGTAGDANGGASVGGGPQWRAAADVAPTLPRQLAEQTGQDAANGLHVVELAAFGGNNTSGPIDVATARTASHTASHTASGRQDFESETFVVASARVAPSLRAQAQAQAQASHRTDSDVYVAHALRAEGFDASEDGTGCGTPIVPVAIAFTCKDSGADAGSVAPTMRAMGHSGSHANAGGQIAVAFSLRGREGGAMPEVEAGDLSPAIRAAEGGSTRPFVAAAMAVRRITVVEAEILQGFRPNATLIDWPSANRKGEDLGETIGYLIGHGLSIEDATRLAQTPDGNRYKAIGNSWPVPVAAWIGRRIMESMNA